MRAGRPEGHRHGKIITFYSYKGGAGRTMSLANIAWLLASSGNRVLAVDWDLEAPGLHRYLHPFLPDHRLRTSQGVIEMIGDYVRRVINTPATDKDSPVIFSDTVLDYAVSLQWPFPGEGTLDFIPAGKQDPAYPEAMSNFNWVSFYEQQGGDQFLEAMRKDMAATYDYVLIDSRTGMSDTSGICAVTLPDILVCCFTPSNQSIEGTARLATSVLRQRHNRSITIFPVPMRVEPNLDDRLRAAYNFAAWSFRDALPHWQVPEINANWRSPTIDAYWQRVQIPYDPYFSFEEILTPFAPDTVRSGPLLPALTRLCREVTGSEIAPLALFERAHQQRQETFLRPPSCQTLICHARNDIMWARWLSELLTAAGISVSTHAVRAGEEFHHSQIDELSEAFAIPGCTSAVVVKTTSSRNLLSAAQAAARACELPHGLIVVDTIDTAQEKTQDREESLRLADMTDEVVLATLLRSVDPDGHAFRKVTTFSYVGARPRSGTDLPNIHNVPDRDLRFVGRQSLIEELHERLNTAGADRVQVLHGVSGVGKSAMVVEYIHRFGASYDMVWWVSARQLSTTQAVLGQLANELGIGHEESNYDRIIQLFDVLAQGKRFRHWLLVYDDVHDAVAAPMPERSGHVIVTSQEAILAEAPALHVPLLDREESMSLLNACKPRMSVRDRRQLAMDAGGLPQALIEVARGFRLRQS